MKNLLLYLLILNSCIYSQSWVQLNDIGAVTNGSPTSTPPYKEAVCLSHNGKIYIIGCVTSASYTPVAKLWQYDTALDSWEYRSDYPGTGNVGLAGFVIGDFFYIGGGNNGLSPSSTDYHKYNPATNQWQTIAPIPAGRTKACGFSIGNKGYICCGTSSYTLNLADLWEYDTTANNWTQKANLPGPARYTASSFTAMNLGFVGLGYGNSTWLSDFYKYNPVTNSWTNTSVFPGQGRCQAGAVSLTGKGLILCGNNGMPVLNDCYLYDAITDVWSTQIPFGGSARSNLIYGNFGNKIFAGGGNDVGGGGVKLDLWSLQTSIGIEENKTIQEKINIYQISQTEVCLKIKSDEFINLNYNIYTVDGKFISSGKIKSNHSVIELNTKGVYILKIENLKLIKFLFY